MKRFKYVAHTDGSCVGNPGPGGYAARYSEIGSSNQNYLCGCEKDTTTNNRMELMAIIVMAENIETPSDILVYTDSNYVCSVASKLTEIARARKTWTPEERKSKPLVPQNMKNHDLWERFIASGNKNHHKFTFAKVAGHSGNAENDEMDKMAKAMAKKACLGFNGLMNQR